MDATVHPHELARGRRDARWGRAGTRSLDARSGAGRPLSHTGSPPNGSEAGLPLTGARRIWRSASILMTMLGDYSGRCLAAEARAVSSCSIIATRSGCMLSLRRKPGGNPSWRVASSITGRIIFSACASTSSLW